MKMIICEVVQTSWAETAGFYFFTVGLWEVVGTPTELVFQGEEMAFDVGYDENDRVDKVTVLKKK